MARPIMHPQFHDPDLPAAPKLRRNWIGPCVTALVRIMLWRPTDLFRREPPARTLSFSRFFRGLVYRILFLPALLAIIVALMVYQGTHPRQPAVETDPISQAVYYDPVTFVSDDGTHLDAWLVPVVDAKRVLAEKDDALTKRRPAVILLHGHGSSRVEVLPLVRPLHDAGWVVLAVSLRGASSLSPRAQTFGLDEATDAKAAIEMLRRRPFVDATKIALVGLGTGGNAAILATDRDPAIAATVLGSCELNGDDVVARYIVPRQAWCWWLNAPCRWGFEIAYGLDAEDLDVRNFDRSLSTRPVLKFGHPGPTEAALPRKQISQIVGFLHQHLDSPVVADGK